MGNFNQEKPSKSQKYHKKQKNYNVIYDINNVFPVLYYGTKVSTV